MEKRCCLLLCLCSAPLVFTLFFTREASLMVRIRTEFSVSGSCRATLRVWLSYCLQSRFKKGKLNMSIIPTALNLYFVSNLKALCLQMQNMKEFSIHFTHYTFYYLCILYTLIHIRVPLPQSQSSQYVLKKKLLYTLPRVCLNKFAGSIRLNL